MLSSLPMLVQVRQMYKRLTDAVWENGYRDQ